MPIRTVAFLCRGCGAIFRSVEEAQQHELNCPEVAMEKKRLHDRTQEIHEAEVIREPHPTATIRKRDAPISS